MTMAKLTIAKKECVLSSIVKLIPILLIFFVGSCGTPTDIAIPKGTITDTVMVKVLTDLHLVEGGRVGNKMMGDTIRATVYTAKVYKKYSVTEKEFERSFRFYTANPELMGKIYEKVIENLNKIEANAQRSTVKDDITREQTTIASPISDISKKLKAQKDSAENSQAE